MVEIIVEIDGRYCSTGSAPVVQVDLVLGQRLSLEWTGDSSNMYNQFEAVDSHTLNNGEYVLDSNHPFVLNIENGKPSRPDFVRTDW